MTFKDTTSMLQLSIIICTHNPRKDLLDRTLKALQVQTLASTEWELLLIDNNSKRAVSETIDLSWHPNSRIIVEEKLGLTPARIRGINEAKVDILLFVDDDNILDNDYLNIAVTHIKQNPLIGTLGAGKIIPEFEAEPSPEKKPYEIMLAIRNENRAYYSNEIKFSKAIPYGAGLCILKSIADNYVISCEKRSLAASLDRSGDALLSGGDVDLALHACEAGYIAGVIPQLRLTHIIPKSRLETGYLINIAAGHAFSHYMLGRMWGYLKDYPENPLLKTLRYQTKRFKSSGLAKQIFIAEQQAVNAARAAWNKNPALTSKPTT